MKKNSRKIGKNIQSLVNQYFKRQNIFAKLLGVTSQSVSAWIKGEFEPSLDILIKLEKLTGVTILEWCESDVIFDASNPEDSLHKYLKTVKNTETLDFTASDATPPHTGRYTKILQLPANVLDKKEDEAATLRERIAILETTNLYRAGKIEELEARVGNLEARVKQLENKGETIDK